MMDGGEMFDLPGVVPDEIEIETDDLNDRQEMFCQEYVKDFNGARAARDAGYSEKTAAAKACELLKLPKIKRRIRFAKQELLDKIDVDRMWIASRMMRMLDTEMRDVAEWGPEHQEKRAKDGALIVSPGVTLIPSEDLTRNAAYAVQEIGNTKEGVKIKLHDKRAVAMDLARLLGLVTEKVDHSGKVEQVVSSGPDLSAMTPEQLKAYEAFLIAMATPTP